MGSVEMKTTVADMTMLCQELGCETISQVYDAISNLGECYKVDRKTKTLREGKLSLEFDDDELVYVWKYKEKKKPAEILDILEVLQTCYKSKNSASMFLGAIS